jgi:general secretion pathway protein H
MLNPTTRTSGFTLIELMLVLAIMAVSAALVVPRFADSLENVRVKTALRDASNMMRRARVHSVLERKEYLVVVDREEGTLTLQQSETQDEEDAPTLSGMELPRGLTISGMDMDFSGSKKEKKQEKWSKKYLTFYPMGTSSGGCLYLADSKDRHYTIEINPFTGRVSIFNE